MNFYQRLSEGGGGGNPSGTELLNPSDIIAENGASNSKLVI